MEPWNRSQPGGPVQQPYLLYWPARLHSLAESIPRNQFLGSINIYKYGLGHLWAPIIDSIGLVAEGINKVVDERAMNPLLTSKFNNFCKKVRGLIIPLNLTLLAQTGSKAGSKDNATDTQTRSTYKGICMLMQIQ